MTHMDPRIDAALSAHVALPEAATGVINPYALVEHIEGRKIDWNRIDNVPALLEDVLATPYHELFDPAYGGPLYTGLALEGDQIKPVRPKLLDVQIKLPANDLELEPVDLQEVRTLRDLGTHYNLDPLSDVEVRRVEPGSDGDLNLTLRLSSDARLERLAQILTPEVIRTITTVPEDDAGSTPPDWTPANAHWRDTGRFFNEAAEVFDPRQGAVANCYYIAALSAVAWAMPFRIQQMSRATGTGQQSFTSLFRFHKVDSGGQIDKEIEVTDALPARNSTNSLIYCRSTESGEIWPGLYEKAFAKFKTGHTGDRPDITKTGWGDACHATALLTGGTRTYKWHNSQSGTDLWNFVRAHSRGKRTYHPMVCGTYSTGTASERGISYSDANVVGSHAYTIMGWAYANRRKYIVLRNPWASTEVTATALTGTISMKDVDWWRPINLATNDGIFAIEADTFKTHFAWSGVVA